ncbi:MAG: hypothetical protein LIO41_01480 [Ruminococcus sp.]|nr:hypothetical protein [Ruminococcus sp.]
MTEEQVFQPERKNLAWVINNRLLNGYGFKYVEAYFCEPDISNPDDLYKLLSVCNNAGGLTPNKAKQILFESLGEISEDFEGDWANEPLNYTRIKPSENAQLDEALQQQIAKAASNHDDEIVAVMKEVKKVLSKGLTSSENRSIINYSDDQPRDEHGRFSSVGGSSSSSSGTKDSGKTKYAPSPQRQKKGIQVTHKKYAKLTGIMNTRYPNLKPEDGRKTINDANNSYSITADGYGGMVIHSRVKIK